MIGGCLVGNSGIPTWWFRRGDPGSAREGPALGAGHAPRRMPPFAPDLLSSESREIRGFDRAYFCGVHLPGAQESSRISWPGIPIEWILTEWNGCSCWVQPNSCESPCPRRCPCVCANVMVIWRRKGCVGKAVAPRRLGVMPRLVQNNNPSSRVVPCLVHACIRVVLKRTFNRKPRECSDVLCSTRQGPLLASTCTDTSPWCATRHDIGGEVQRIPPNTASCNKLCPEASSSPHRLLVNYQRDTWRP